MYKNIIKTIIDFRKGYAKITDIINVIGVDLLDSDIEDLEVYIQNYKNNKIKK